MKFEQFIGILKFLLGAVTVYMSIHSWSNVGSTYDNSDQLAGLLIGLISTLYFAFYIFYSGFKQIKSSKPKRIFLNIWLTLNLVILFGCVMSLIRNPNHIMFIVITIVIGFSLYEFLWHKSYVAKQNR